MTKNEMLRPWLRGLQACRAELRRARYLKARSNIRKVAGVEVGLRCVYLFTTNKGVYRLDSSGIYRILKAPAYGIAIKGEWVFLALFAEGCSSVVRGDRRALVENGRPLSFRELYRIETPSSNERIHQIFCSEDALWVANTPRNTLLKIDPEECRVLAEIPVMLDRFGQPVMFDNNHINSVAEWDGVVLFAAYRAGEESMIGVYDGEAVTGYAYRNVGVHDIFLTEDDFYFCDTFGNGETDSGGAPITGDGVLDPAFFERPPGCIVRGLAGSSEELLIGHSHKGSRAKRFNGHGAILVSRNGKVVSRIDVAPAQVYQIITSDGDFVIPRPAKVYADGVRQVLAKALGDPIYQAKVTPL
jgi:hypothetical protein